MTWHEVVRWTFAGATVVMAVLSWRASRDARRTVEQARSNLEEYKRLRAERSGGRA